MLIVWTKDPEIKTLSSLSPVIAHFPGDIRVVNNYSVPPGTKALLAMGTDSWDFLTGQGILPKNKKITSLREAGTFKYIGMPALITYSPSVGNINWEWHTDMLTDVGMALRLAQTGTTMPQLGTYIWVPDFLPAIDKITEMAVKSGKPVAATLDLETKGLDPLDPSGYIVCCSISYMEGFSEAVYFASRADMLEKLAGPIGDQIKWLMSTPNIRLKGANFGFDKWWLKYHGAIDCTNDTMDTTLVGSLLDENRANGLDVHVKIYVPALGGYSDEFDRTVDKSRMDLVPKDKMLPYVGGDTDGTLRTSNVFIKELVKDPQLAGFYFNILHPASRAFEALEQGGVFVDKDRLEALRLDLEIDMDKKLAHAKQVLGGHLVAKHYDSSKPGGLNLTKPSLLKDFFFGQQGLHLKPKQFTEKPNKKTGEQIPSTAMDHLMLFKDHPDAKPLCDVLEGFSQAQRTLNTYVTGFLQHLRYDGRFHPHYFLFKGNKNEDEGGTVCLPAGELVLTNRGYLPIERVGSGDQVITHTGVARTVLHSVDNGVKPIVRVTMSNGLQLKTTSNHPYRIGKGWVEAGSLSVGMQAWAHSGVEEWEAIAGWLDFEVSSWGRVFNKKTKNFLTQNPKGKWGHLKVCLYRNGAQKRGEDRKDFAIHKLVADAFLEKFGGTEVRHLNGIAWDNTATNLEWGSTKENKQDAVHQGTLSKRQGTQAKLTEDAVVFIRSDASSHLNNTQLAKVLGVTRELVRDVRLGKRWVAREFPGKIAEFKPVFVVAIEHLPSEPTYGIEVEVDHSHVTGGVVTHNTGRLSAKNPAFQTIPKHHPWAKQIRMCYTAPPGYLVMERDYSQGELKVVACIAHEANMIAAYKAGLDLHIQTSARFAGLTYGELAAMGEMEHTDPAKFHYFEETRQLGKAGNFGLLYAMGVDGFIEFAYATYGVKLSYDEAKTFRDGFFESYPMLLVYHDEYKKFVHNNGWVRTPLGRIRHLPLINSPFQDIRALAERQAINSPVQGTLSDLLLWSMAIEHAQGLTKVSPAFAAVHDASYSYLPEDQYESIVPKHLHIMENLPFHLVNWNPELQFTADAKIGPSMGELKKWAGSHG